MKKHLKRLAAPKTWQLARKKEKFTVRALPKAQGLKLSLPLLIIIRDILNYATNAREVNKILKNKEVLIDGKRVKNAKQSAGLMDAISFPEIKENFRIMLNTKGKLYLEKINAEEAKQKICKIIKKKVIKGNKIQLTLHDGRNIISEKNHKNNYKIGDSLAIVVPEQTISEHLRLEKGSQAYLTGGKHLGLKGTIEKIEQEKLFVKIANEVVEAKKKFVFVMK